MHAVTTFSAFAVAASLAFTPAALADTAASTENEALPPLELEPNASPSISYEQFRIEELQRGALRSRNALIGTSVAAAVGLALVIPAANQCQSVEVNGNDEYQCSRAGSALYGVGGPLVFGGLTGAVVSGIILGVRKGKLRRMNDTFSYSKARAVRWDERRSLLVF